MTWSVLRRQAIQGEYDAVMKAGRRRWWWFRGEFYYHTIEDDDVLIVKGLILQKLERDKKRHNRALEALRRHETEESH